MAYELGYDLNEAIERENISKENIVAIRELVRESKLPYVPDNLTEKLVRYSICHIFCNLSNSSSDSSVHRCM